MRRYLETRDGITVSLVRLELRSPYYSAVEITRIDSATEYLLEQAVARGDLVFGVDPKHRPRQLPAEVVIAELHSTWLPDPKAVAFPDEVRTQRTLRIYQGDGEDPLAAVAAVVRGLDWARVAQVDHWA